MPACPDKEDGGLFMRLLRERTLTIRARTPSGHLQSLPRSPAIKPSSGANPRVPQAPFRDCDGRSHLNSSALLSVLTLVGIELPLRKNANLRKNPYNPRARVTPKPGQVVSFLLLPRRTCSFSRPPALPFRPLRGLDKHKTSSRLKRKTREPLAAVCMHAIESAHL